MWLKSLVGSDMATSNENERYENGKVNNMSQIYNIQKSLEENQVDESMNLKTL